MVPSPPHPLSPSRLRPDFLLPHSPPLTPRHSSHHSDLTSVESNAENIVAEQQRQNSQTVLFKVENFICVSFPVTRPPWELEGKICSGSAIWAKGAFFKIPTMGFNQQEPPQTWKGGNSRRSSPVHGSRGWGGSEEGSQPCGQEIG